MSAAVIDVLLRQVQKNNPGIRTVNLAHLKLTPELIQSLQEALAANNYVTTLDLQAINDLTWNNLLDPLAQILKTNAAIVRLKLGHGDLNIRTSLEGRAIPDAIACNPNSAVKSLASPMIDEIPYASEARDSSGLYHSFTGLNLRELDLGTMNLPTRQIERNGITTIIADYPHLFARNASLFKFTTSEPLEGDDVAVNNAPNIGNLIITKYPHVTQYRLNYNSIELKEIANNADLSPILALLMNPESQVTEISLDLSTSIDFSIFREAFRLHGHKFRNITFKNISLSQLKPIAALLSMVPSLQKLNLSFSEEDSTGSLPYGELCKAIDNLYEALGKQKILTELKLNCSVWLMRYGSAERLIDALPNTLKKLFIGWAESFFPYETVTQEDAQKYYKSIGDKLVSSLHKMQHLESLHFIMNKQSSAACLNEVQNIVPAINKALQENILFIKEFYGYVDTQTILSNNNLTSVSILQELTPEESRALKDKKNLIYIIHENKPPEPTINYFIAQLQLANLYSILIVDNGGKFCEHVLSCESWTEVIERSKAIKTILDEYREENGRHSPEWANVGDTIKEILSIQEFARFKDMGNCIENGAMAYKLCNIKRQNVFIAIQQFLSKGKAIELEGKLFSITPIDGIDFSQDMSKEQESMKGKIAQLVEIGDIPIPSTNVYDFLPQIQVQFALTTNPLQMFFSFKEHYNMQQMLDAILTNEGLTHDKKLQDIPYIREKLCTILTIVHELFPQGQKYYEEIVHAVDPLLGIMQNEVDKLGQVLHPGSLE